MADETLCFGPVSRLGPQNATDWRRDSRQGREPRGVSRAAGRRPLSGQRRLRVRGLRVYARTPAAPVAAARGVFEPGTRGRLRHIGPARKRHGITVNACCSPLERVHEQQRDQKGGGAAAEGSYRAEVEVNEDNPTASSTRDLSGEQLTREAVASFDGASTERFREIMQSLVRHLHA